MDVAMFRKNLCTIWDKYIVYALSKAYQNVGRKVFCPTNWADKLDLILSLTCLTFIKN